eukprot:TRINITY_DN14166_c0_g1_i1.p1 TRINITY_DN14166_c0_g1~~TRINITY_DN14166_c0_g1_i1.p1  ORF type:complete len:464 (-),score=38.51 TRINITY_DN14166_c0_g1_i1:129-1520(-)
MGSAVLTYPLPRVKTGCTLGLDLCAAAAAVKTTIPRDHTDVCFICSMSVRNGLAWLFSTLAVLLAAAIFLPRNAESYAERAPHGFGIVKQVSIVGPKTHHLPLPQAEREYDAEATNMTFDSTQQSTAETGLKENTIPPNASEEVTIAAEFRAENTTNEHTPGSAALARVPKGCPFVFMKFTNDFGGHNNQLLTLLNAFTITKRYNYTMVLPYFIEGATSPRPQLANPWSVYDLRPFWVAGYCFINSRPALPKDAVVLSYTAYQLFRVLPRNHSRPYHLLRPSIRISREVQAVLATLPANFTGVHRRIGIATMYSCKNTPRPPYCWIRPSYIREAQDLTNVSTRQRDPVFLATDMAKVRLASIPSVRYHGKFSGNKLDAVVIDFFVLTQAAVVIANPSSSLALNVCNFRRMLTPPKQCFNFTFCNDRPPFIAGWPCGSPVPGLSTHLPAKWLRKQIRSLREKRS